ncbi:MAG: hypothetical protein FJ096_19920 [Deltaproteobacteria bacterium]|nr:hypothetical protein [Deltaproteobacteria bacterium]
MARDEHKRRAWVALGGYIAGADGLSAEEADSLGRASAGPELSADESIALIVAAGSKSLPEESLAAAEEADVAVTVDRLLEIAHAVASDGMSPGEWTRFREVAARLLGEGKVDALVRLVVSNGEARKARRELLG